MRPLLPLALLVVAALPAMAADAPRLGWPLDCRLGDTCWLLNLVDDQPGPEARDFRCGTRSYQAHDGTDIALKDTRAMEKGVVVRAAAPGVVKATRDGEAEGQWFHGDKEAAKGRECGNRVAIDHGGGWLTDYCHLRRGSVLVHPGDRVEAGQPLGLVGLSGMTAFPHLHISLRHVATVVDPFTGRPAAEGCGHAAAPGPSAAGWADPPEFRPTELYAAGFADHVPDDMQLKTDASSAAALPADAPAVVLWGAVLGPQAGDVVRFRLVGPDGSEVQRHSATIPRSGAWRFEAAGKKRGQSGWAPGRWRGEVTLERAGAVLGSRQLAVVIR